MSAPAFTSGRWWVVGSSGFLLVGAGKLPTERRENWVAHINEDQLASKANANLIAAAPELYAALEAVCKNSEGLEQGGSVRVPRVQKLWLQAQAALAKARGEA